MIETDLVDGPDRGLGVGVGREEDFPRVRVDLDRFGEELRAGHVRHAFVDQEERELGAAMFELGNGFERLCAGGRLHDAVVGAEVLAEVALDGVEDFGVVVDCQEDRLGHMSDITLPPIKGSEPLKPKFQGL